MKIEINKLISFLNRGNNNLLIIGKNFPFFLISFIKKNLVKNNFQFFNFSNLNENFFYNFSEDIKNKCFFEFIYEKDRFDIFIENFNKNLDYKNLVFINKEIIKNYKKKDLYFFDSELLISFSDFLDLQSFFEDKIKKYIEIIFKKFKFIEINKLFFLINYGEFLKISVFENFLKTIENEILKDQYSLFDLCTYFLKKDKSNFYLLWNSFKENYESEFWNSYWLKQFWNAYKFLDESEKNNFNYKYNLPFWFIKYGKLKFTKDIFEKILIDLYNQDIFLKTLGLENINNKIYACEKIFLNWF